MSKAKAKGKGKNRQRIFADHDPLWGAIHTRHPESLKVLALRCQELEQRVEDLGETLALLVENLAQKGEK